MLAAGLAAGVGAIFRAPLAGAIFAAEVLYREPDIEAEVVVPALLSSIVSYSLYCSVHGFGHLLTGTEAFAFRDPRALGCYVVLGLVTAFAGIGFVKFFDIGTAYFKKLPVSNFVKPIIGGALTGLIGLVAFLATSDQSVLAVMGSGYGMLQQGVSEIGGIGPSIAMFAFVAFGKILTTTLTIGSGGSGGVFGPSMVIGGCLGAAVGTAFHALFPSVVPNVGPFTIVGMAGFFAGVANAPISTLLIVGDLTGNYSLLLPSMLVVGMSIIIAHRWTVYPEQIRTRADSPAHRDEFVFDVLASLRVDEVFDSARPMQTLAPDVSMRQILHMVSETTQQVFPMVHPDGSLMGVVSLGDIRKVVHAPEVQKLVVAEDLATTEVATVTREDSLRRALHVLTLKDLEEVPVVDGEDKLLGMLSRREVFAAYNRRLTGRQRRPESRRGLRDRP